MDPSEASRYEDDAFRLVASRMHSAEPLRDSLQWILEEVRASTSAEAASIALRAPLTGESMYVAAVGAGRDAVIGTRLPPGEGIVGWVMDDGDIDFTLDALRDPRHSPDIDRLTQTRTRSLATVPLRAGEFTLGTLQVLNPTGRRPFGEEDTEVLARFARTITAGIVQRGEHRHLGLQPEALREFELRRQLTSWSGAGEAFAEELKSATDEGGPIMTIDSGGARSQEVARALHGYHNPGAPFVTMSAADFSEALLAGQPTAEHPEIRLSQPGASLHLTELDRLSPKRAELVAEQVRRVALDAGARVVLETRGRPAGECVELCEGRVVTVPPLRARTEDLPAMVGNDLRRLRGALGVPALGFELEALEALESEWSDWTRTELEGRIAAILLDSQAQWITQRDVIEHQSQTGGSRDTDLRQIVTELHDPSGRIRSEALRRLEHGEGAKEPDLIGALIDCLAEEQDWLRIRIIRLIGAQADRRSVRPLLEQLATETDPSMARELLAALGRSGSRAAIEPLVRHLRDPSPDTRATVLFALGRIGGREAREAVLELSSDQDPRVRCTAQGALYHIDSGQAQLAAGGPGVRLAAYLVTLEGSAETDRLRLSEGPVTIGRTSHTDVTLPDPKVSKNHAVLELENGEWTLRDLGSTNGTVVSGERIHQKVLVDGDLVSIGSFSLRFEEDTVDDAPPVAELTSLEATLFQTIVPGAIAALRGDTPSPPPPPPPVMVDSPAVERLLEETRSDDAAARQWAARVLGEIGAGAGRIFELLSDDPDPEVRVESARALGQSRNPQAVKPLIQELDDRLLRFAIIEALGALRAPEAVDPLIELLVSERNSRLRRAAIRALGEIGHPRAVETLSSALEVETIAADAVDALARIGGEAATEALSRHLDPKDPLCSKVTAALGNMRSVAAVPALIELLSADDEAIAAQAGKALEKIGPEASAPLIEALATHFL